MRGDIDRTWKASRPPFNVARDARAQLVHDVVGRSSSRGSMPLTPSSDTTDHTWNALLALFNVVTHPRRRWPLVLSSPASVRGCRWARITCARRCRLPCVCGRRRRCPWRSRDVSFVVRTSCRRTRCNVSSDLAMTSLLVPQLPWQRRFASIQVAGEM